MKITTLLETMTTTSSDPASNQSQQAPEFGRDPKVLENDDKLDETTSGAISTGEPTNMGVQRRGKGSMFQGIKTSKKFPNSAAVKEGVAEGKQIWDGTDWGPQGRFAGDTHVDVGGAVMKMIQVGDIVKYFGQKAEVVALSKDRKRARIKIKQGMGGITQDVNTNDLKQLGQGMAEADELRARGGLAAVNKKPRIGQTDMRNIPVGNHPDARINKFTDKDRAEHPSRLKAKIKSTLGKHTRPNLPEQGVAESSWNRDPEQDQMDANRRGALSREREPQGSDKIDTMLAQRNAQLQQYNETGKFWLKKKDSQEHVSNAYVGKAAANQAAIELLKQNPELKGNIVITAWGPGETPMNEAELSEEQILAKDLKKQLELFKKAVDNDLGSKPNDKELGKKPKDKEVQKK